MSFPMACLLNSAELPVHHFSQAAFQDHRRIDAILSHTNQQAYMWPVLQLILSAATGCETLYRSESLLRQPSCLTLVSGTPRYRIRPVERRGALFPHSASNDHDIPETVMGKSRSSTN